MPETNDLAELLRGADPVRWLFTGDSVTQGASHTRGHRDYVQRFEERVRWDLGRRRDHVLRTAVSGRCVDDLIADLDWSLTHYRADAVLLMLGLNDARVDRPDAVAFEQGLVRVVDAARRAGARFVAIQTPNRAASANPAAYHAELDRFAGAARRAAERSSALLIDHYAHWATACADEVDHHWLSDELHPNATGHRILAETLTTALGL